jgi:hypothetical protein
MIEAGFRRFARISRRLKRVEWPQGFRPDVRKGRCDDPSPKKREPSGVPGRFPCDSGFEHRHP